MTDTDLLDDFDDDLVAEAVKRLHEWFAVDLISQVVDIGDAFSVGREKKKKLMPAVLGGHFQQLGLPGSVSWHCMMINPEDCMEILDHLRAKPPFDEMLKRAGV